jgi:hypothetical protein
MPEVGPGAPPPRRADPASPVVTGWDELVESGKTVNTESEGIPNGSPFTYRLMHRVVRYRELPGTPENRRLFELHGGEAQGRNGGP